MKLLFPCPLCFGKGRVGDHGPSVVCSACGGPGHIIKAPEDLSLAEQEQALAAIVRAAPPAAAYDREQSAGHISRMLTGFRIESVTIPEEHPGEILITNKRGLALRILPETRAGVCHHLTVLPEPPGTVESE